MRTPKAWQKDYRNIDTGYVQFWSNGIMVTARMIKTDAIELVRSGKAFVITGQAIGMLDKGQMAS